VSEADKTIRQLKAEIDTDLSKFAQQYLSQLRQTTPVLTGRARQGWQSTFRKKLVGNGKDIPIARNNVPYIGVLDTGSSRQAPNGIVEPALRKTRKR